MAKPLQAGNLDRTLDLFTKDAHKNGKGEKIGESPSPFAQNVPCRKRETGGVETGGDGSGSAQASRETAFGTVEFDLRYRTGVLETMILYCEGVRYDILNVREGEGRRQWLIIEAQKHD
ncbi:phage head completion protein [Spirosoma agri]|uniref:Head-tail adaptor protein n=1 Tax=Spirosoma agri TaxID=1987381 RepID=A0A6M0IKX8_9BACT|nr:head-tail adaptor protein [Spirosoma agri]NEU68315.1 head-tail adaptor protein [Spirosoma agri]